jgi:SNF2 family DNA or RNA helicase
MYRDNIDLFEKLKIKHILDKREKYLPAIFFQLNFDKNGAFLKLVDERQIEVEVNPKYYSGPVYQVLKAIVNIKKRNSLQVNWLNNQENRIYLADNDFLIEYLLKCENFVDSRFKPVRLMEGEAETIVLIEGENPYYSKVTIFHEGRTRYNALFLNENYAFTDSAVYRIPSLGKDFRNIYYFETSFRNPDLEKFLTMLFSSFDNISVNYYGFTQTAGPAKQTSPALIFEKVDAEHSLYVRFSKALPGLDSEFLENYQVSKVASVNHIAHTITVSELREKELYPYFEEVEKILSKYKKLLKSKNDYFIFENTFIIEEALAKEFVYKELHYLVSRFTIFGTDNLKTYNVRTVTPRLSVSLTHGIDFLEGDATLEIEGEVMALTDVLNSYSRNSYILLSDGTNAIINKTYIDKLKRLFKRNKDKITISFFDLPIVEEMIDEKIATDFFRRSREIFLGFNRLKEMELSLPPVNAVLRPYQEHGYRWLKYLYDHSLGGCLADDMGLGKTLQTLTLLSSLYPEEPLSSLVIMPKSLLFNWENEINKFNPNLTYYTFYGLNRDMKEAKTKNIILTTYAMIRNEIDKFREEPFLYVVLDESQNIKNFSSQISRAVVLLKAKYRLSLSGTPIENNLTELYSLFRFLNPSMFGSIEEFNRYYVNSIQKENDKDAAVELRKKIYPFILRRLKKDVLQELPDKIEQTLFVEMSPEQKEFYEQRRLFYYKTVKEQIASTGVKKSQFYILQALSELRQIASIPESKSDNTLLSPKREVLIENIIEVIANDHKVLVFANFLNALDLISEDLEKAEIKHLIMTGATRDRKVIIEKFQNDHNYKVFLMTLKTGGLGLNLTAADFIFIFDPWWNKAAENQAIDRAHRIGQDKTVFSYKLITKNTIEEKILQLQDRKIELFDSVISNDGASIKSLDEKDVEFILGN